jgi:hypothetical protein
MLPIGLVDVLGGLAGGETKALADRRKCWGCEASQEIAEGRSMVKRTTMIVAGGERLVCS